MDLIYIYGIVVGGIFLSLMVLTGIPHIVHIIRYVSSGISRHMMYRYPLRRHRLAGPWSRAGILLQSMYIAANLTCTLTRVSGVGPRISTLSEAGLRAGELCIVNLIVVMVGSHLSLLADLLGVNLSTIRQVHRSSALMTVVLASFHTMVSISSRAAFDLGQPENLFAVVVSVEIRRYIAPLTVNIGSLIAGVHCFTLTSDMSQAFLRMLSMDASCYGSTYHLFYMATSTIRQALSPLYSMCCGRVVLVAVHCPRQHHCLSKWYFSVWPHTSPCHARKRRCKSSHTVPEASSNRGRAIRQLMDALSQLLVLPSSPPIRGDLLG